MGHPVNAYGNYIFIRIIRDLVALYTKLVCKFCDFFFVFVKSVQHVFYPKSQHHHPSTIYKSTHTHTDNCQFRAHTHHISIQKHTHTHSVCVYGWRALVVAHSRSLVINIFMEIGIVMCNSLVARARSRDCAHIYCFELNWLLVSCVCVCE